MTVFRFQKGASNQATDVLFANVENLTVVRPDLAASEAELVIEERVGIGEGDSFRHTASSVEMMERGANSPVYLHEDRAHGEEKDFLRLQTGFGKVDVRTENIVGFRPAIRYGLGAEIIVQVESEAWKNDQRYTAEFARPVSRDSGTSVPLHP